MNRTHIVRGVWIHTHTHTLRYHHWWPQKEGKHTAIQTIIIAEWNWTTEIITRRKIAHIISKFNKSVFLLRATHTHTAQSIDFLHIFCLTFYCYDTTKSNACLVYVHCSSNWIFASLFSHSLALSPQLLPMLLLCLFCHRFFYVHCVDIAAVCRTMTMDGLCCFIRHELYAIINNRQRVSKHICMYSTLNITNNSITSSDIASDSIYSSSNNNNNIASNSNAMVTIHLEVFWSVFWDDHR